VLDTARDLSIGVDPEAVRRPRACPRGVAACYSMRGVDSCSDCLPHGGRRNSLCLYHALDELSRSEDVGYGTSAVLTARCFKAHVLCMRVSSHMYVFNRTRAQAKQHAERLQREVIASADEDEPEPPVAAAATTTKPDDEVRRAGAQRRSGTAARRRSGAAAQRRGGAV
jgi:hypothetical protein